jgi:hypothetical protein
MLEAVLLLGFIAFSFAIAYPIVMIELSLPLNPFRIRRGIREKREHKQIRRISKLEHDLGYKPCSDSECYSCNRMVEMPDGSYYQMRPDINHLIEQGWDKEVGVSLWKRTGTVSGGPR